MNYQLVLKRTLLLFWSCWLTLVFGSNFADALQQAGMISQSWRFASGNFGLIQEVVGIYSFTKLWAPVLFGAVVFVELAAALLFWRACLDRESVVVAQHPKVLQAFLVAIGLFAGFLLADEIFVVYVHRPGLGTTHLLALCALLLSLIFTTFVVDQVHKTSRQSPLTNQAKSGAEGP